MKRAELLVLDVPTGVTTCTATVPAPTGAVAVIVVPEVTVKSVEALLPKSTALAPVKPEPEMRTVSPPPAVPLDGDSAATETAFVPVLDEPLLDPDGGTIDGGTVVVAPLAMARVARGPVAGDPKFEASPKG